MKKGFTLIELLVVMGIVGLLAFFLVPNLLGAKDKAKETAVKSVLHSLQLAVEAYNMENEVYPLENNAGVETLCKNYLIGGSYIAKIPQNPFTNQEYKETDAAGKIIYSYDNNSGKYTLTGYGRSGFKKILELSNL